MVASETPFRFSNIFKKLENQRKPGATALYSSEHPYRVLIRGGSRELTCLARMQAQGGHRTVRKNSLPDAESAALCTAEPLNSGKCVSYPGHGVLWHLPETTGTGGETSDGIWAKPATSPLGMSPLAGRPGRWPFGCFLTPLWAVLRLAWRVILISLKCLPPYLSVIPNNTKHDLT